MRFGQALKRLWLFISMLAGALATIAAAVMAFLLPLAIVLGVRSGGIVEKWPAFHWLAVLALSMMAFLNMLLFFSRLKKSNPDFYHAATEGWPVSAYIMSSQSAYRLLHGWVVRVATDPAAPFARELRSHASFTRYLNLSCLYGWLSLILAALGFAMYVSLAR